jgi:tRNA dimethylallyltransferase
LFILKISNDKPIIILGPTATGKTALAIELACRNNGEIISLDSMQVYRGMDIGTAKPSAAEMMKCLHHMIDCRNISETSDVARFLEMALAAQRDIESRGKLPVFAGGTAMYIKNLVDGLFEGPPASPEIREELLALAKQKGDSYLHEHILKQVDPDIAENIHPNDVRRVIRAIEVYRTSGVPLSKHQQQWHTPSEQVMYRMIGLTLPREELYSRIEERVDAMIAAGLTGEVRKLMKKGIEQNYTASQAIGYKELIAHLNGEYSLDKAVELIKRNTRRFAKHQLTWFRKDGRIAWFDVARYETQSKLADAVEEYIIGKRAADEAPQRI